MVLRVTKGGHHVPEATIRRRYFRGITNLFEIYMPIVDKWTILDNSDTEENVQLIADRISPVLPTIYNTEIYNQLLTRYQSVR